MVRGDEYGDGGGARLVLAALDLRPLTHRLIQLEEALFDGSLDVVRGRHRLGVVLLEFIRLDDRRQQLLRAVFARHRARVPVEHSEE